MLNRINPLYRFSLLAAALIAVSLLLFTSSAFADESNSSQNVKLTSELAVEIAQDFADSASGQSLTAHNPVKTYQEDGHALGYVVSYYDSYDNPNGYVVLDSSDDSLFSMWSFQSGVASFLEGEGLAECQGLGSEYKVVKLSPFTYGFLVPGSNVILDVDGAPVVTSDCISLASSAPDSSGWEDIFIDGFSSKYTMVSFEHSVDELICFPESEIESLTGTYACAVTAMLNCAPHYVSSFNWGNYAADYSLLWQYSSTTTDYISNGIKYGSTSYYALAEAFSKYCNTKGVTVHYKKSLNPSWSFFKDAIDSGNVAIFSAGININGARSGHSMAVEGYSILKPSSASAAENIYTLFVADGWDQGRFVNFYYTKYTDTHGTSFVG